MFAQGRNLAIVLHVLLDALVHLLKAAEEAGSLGRGGSDTDGEAGQGGSDGAVCWWGSLGNTQEDGLLVLTQSLQTMWDMGKCPTLPEPVEEDVLPAWARTSPGLPSRMDVPTWDEALARESAVTVLGAIRRLAALVWPADHPASVAAADSGSRRGQAAGYADWEVLQADVLTPLPPSSEQPQPIASSSAATASSSSEGAQLLPSASSPSSASCCWGEGLWCFNPACTNLSGPSELAMQTSACGGGCGVRYCSPECQAQGWRDGHRLSCARLRARRERIASDQLFEGLPGGG